MTRRRRLGLLVILALGAAGIPLGALPAAAPGSAGVLPFSIAARSAILIDQTTGRVLYEHNADEPLPPASLAKLMTLHLVYQKLEDRSIRPDDVVYLSANSWAYNQTPGSSLMNLLPGQIVTVDELMKGTAIVSGNDAATALAEYVAGSAAKFVSLMNEESRWMGYTTMHFTDPAGVKPTNVVTAREFADFCRRYIDLHPQSLPELLSVREFEYPLPRNLDEWPRERRMQTRPVKQYNGNYLVWDGIDGLKTGHLDRDNFTAAITARRGNTRLIAVLLGVRGGTPSEGYRRRAEAGMAMLSYGFRTYTTVIPDLPPLPPLRVWKGRDELVGLTPARPIAVTASRNETETLAYSVVTDAAVVAPIRKGETVGHLVFSSDGKEIGRVDLAADRDVEPAGVLKRAWDSVQLEVSQLRAGLIPRRPSESGRSPALDAARPPSGPASPEAAETRPSPTALARGTPK